MLLLLSVHGLAQAATITVGPSGRDHTSIQAAIDAAAAGDRIEVDPGTYAENLTVDKAVYIGGVGGSGSTFLTAPGPVVSVTAGGDLELDDFTVQPTSERGIEVRQAAITLGQVLVEGGYSTLDAGGGLYAVESTVTIELSTFDGNSASTFHGGNVYAYESTLTLRDSELVGGRAEKGGGLYVFGGTALIDHCSFTGNEVRADDEIARGGAIRAQDASLTIEGGSGFESNGAENGYGGAIATSGGDLTIRDTVFRTNSVTELYGGAIAAYDTELVVEDSEFYDNASVLDAGAGSGTGGAIIVYGTGVGTFTLSGSTFSGNHSDLNGGAVQIEAGAATISGSTFDTNDGSGGGAVNLITTSAVTISSSTFTANQSTSGGAIRWRPQSSAATLELSDSTFTGNIVSSGYGGGLYARQGGSADLIGNTFADNESVVGGGVIFWSVDRITAKRNLFCHNRASTASNSDGGGAVSYLSGGGGSNRWTNNVFAENSSQAYGGALNFLDSLTVYVANNTLVENQARTNGGGVAFTRTTGLVTNNLVATSSGNGITADADSVVTITYNDFYENIAESVGDALDPALLDASNLALDPALSAFTADGDCGNDEFWLTEGSPLVDAGDPALTDPDGSRSDIGAYGGPDADPARFTDTDGDGWLDVDDCGPDDEAAFPGATEVPYDGIDQDCDGADLTDADGDTWDAVEAGGEDCDDTDPAVNPGAEEVWYDGVDGDCDGADDHDQDADGSPSPDDCDDLDPNVNPTAADPAGDGVDANCDGEDGVAVGDPGETEDDGKGCACDAGSAGPGAWPFIGLLVALTGRRRRRAEA